MKYKLFGLSGILSFLFFSIGFLIFILINPQILNEIDNLAFSFYNLEGMNGQFWVNYTIYLGAGILGFCNLSGFIIQNRKSTHAIIGLSFLMASTLIWISFGLISKNLEDLEGDGKLILLRTILFILTSIIGLLLIGTVNLNLRDRKLFRWITMIVAITIGILGTLSTFVVMDDTWIRTNFSITLFFLWIGTAGLFLIRNKKTSLSAKNL